MPRLAATPAEIEKRLALHEREHCGQIEAARKRTPK